VDLTQAIAKHAEWKTKFRAAITKQETMDVQTISKDNCCELGKWLHGEAKSKFAKLPSYAACLNKHAAFHTEAAKVAKLINDKNFSQAETMLGANTSYATASSAVGIAINVLKKAAGL
jgi:Chemoreceptor zinc-binding domain